MSVRACSRTGIIRAIRGDVRRIADDLKLCEMAGLMTALLDNAIADRRRNIMVLFGF